MTKPRSLIILKRPIDVPIRCEGVRSVTQATIGPEKPKVAPYIAMMIQNSLIDLTLGIIRVAIPDDRRHRSIKGFLPYLSLSDPAGVMVAKVKAEVAVKTVPKIV